MPSGVDLLLIPPVDTQEAALRIADAMPGAKVDYQLTHNTPLDRRGVSSDKLRFISAGDPQRLLEVTVIPVVDVTEFYEAVVPTVGPGGTGRGDGEAMLWDDWTHERAFFKSEEEEAPITPDLPARPKTLFQKLRALFTR